MAITTDSAERSSLSGSLPEFIAMGRKQVEQIAKSQIGLFDKFHEANRKWLDRWQAGADLYSEFSGKLAAARSLPEAATVYRDLAGRQLRMAGEEAKQILSDTQAMIETGTRMLSDNWLSAASRPASTQSPSNTGQRGERGGRRVNQAEPSSPAPDDTTK